MDREKVIIHTSIIGILVNVLLVVFKAIFGIISNSIAITMDAVNNLSDAISSLITIIGAKLAAKKPDKQHPLGHGRIEYIAATIVEMIVIYAGITSLWESIKKIISPEKASYDILTISVLVVAIIVKFVLGRYVKNKGESVNSNALRDSGMDALFDSIISISVLLSALIFIFFGLSLEAYVGVLISVFIIKSGIDMISETVNDIIGQRVDPEISKRVKELLVEDEEVRGAFDLLVTNYGPDRNFASVHLELPDTMTVDELDVLTRKLQNKVYKETNVALTGISVYSYNTQDDEVVKIRERIVEKVLAYDWALEVHGFYMDRKNAEIRFDVVTTFDITASECLEIINSDVKKMYPDYNFIIIHDIDLSD